MNNHLIIGIVVAAITFSGIPLGYLIAYLSDPNRKKSRKKYDDTYYKKRANNERLDKYVRYQRPVI
jgi:hypothetical protein